MKDYNIEARPRFNKQHKQRIANKLKGNKNAEGVIFTKERLQKMRDSQIESWKDNPNQGMVGKQHSDITKSKIAKSHLKENLSDESLQAYRESAIKRIERQISNGLSMIPSIGLQEIKTIDKYEKNSKSFSCPSSLSPIILDSPI